MFRRRGGRDDAARRDGAPDADAQALQAVLAGLEPRWREPLLRAIASRDQFSAILGQAAPGPARDRLDGLRPTLDEAVQRVADAVTRASRATAIAATLDIDGATDALKRARRELDDLRRAGADTTAAEERAQTFADRHRAVNDAINLAEDAGGQLDQLNARLDTAVAHAATIVLRSTGDGDLEALDRELDEVVVGLSALDDALEQFGR
jgi:RNAse (barnase) inhibitor barstar